MGQLGQVFYTFPRVCVAEKEKLPFLPHLPWGPIRSQKTVVGRRRRCRLVEVDADDEPLAVRFLVD